VIVSKIRRKKLVQVAEAEEPANVFDEVGGLGEIRSSLLRPQGATPDALQHDLQDDRAHSEADEEHVRREI
jgi:hypothetical protein